MGGTWKDSPKWRWWQKIGRCGRCKRIHWQFWPWVGWRTPPVCPHCGSGKVL